MQSRAFRLLTRGESTIASTGLLLAVIVLCAMGASGWWSARAQHQAIIHARQNELKFTGELLAELIESRLATNELSLVRQTVASAARDHAFSDCRVVLPDGEVIAAARASDITLAALPENWGDEPSTVIAVAASDQTISRSFPVDVANRGSAQLLVSASLEPASWNLWDAQAGIGMIGAIALAAILLVYRRMRSRVRAMSYIRESLLAIDAGETALAALTVNEDLGTVAIAWNELLSERERLQQVLVTKRLLELPAAREERSQDLTKMCDAMSQGLVLVDKDLSITYANGAAGLFLGKSREEILGTTVDGCLDDERMLETVRAVASGALRRSTALEIERNDNDTRTVLRFVIRPLRSDDDSAAMIVIEDITQQRVASDSRNTFVAQVTHELRTPLTNILLYAESAMDESNQDLHERAKALNVINQEAKRLERVVSDMLSVAELEAGTHTIRRDDVSLVTLFEELVSDYEAAASEKNLTLTFELPPKLPVIQADRDKIALAVHNLLGNALKYTPENGNVTVRVECDDDTFEVEVKDDGIGMKPSEQEHVFEKFYRAKDARIAGVTGSGLGLALAREVIRLHGGDITVESEYDVGSTFVMKVPLQAHAT